MTSQYHPLTIAVLQDRPILLLGLGREGQSTQTFFESQLPGKAFSVYDDKGGGIELAEAKQLIEHTPDLLIFKTPGIPPAHQLVTLAQEHHVQISSNTQLFFDLLPTVPSPVTTIGVTGTKGKSTTTSLIHHVLSSAGLSSFIGGNIGVPPLQLLPLLKTASATQDQLYVVLEMSAHQLLDLRTSPHIAVIQNIVPEHLDYYASFEAYVAAKANITRWQTENDYLIYNTDFPILNKIAEDTPAQLLAFSTANADKSQIKTQLKGPHNIENIVPSLILGDILHIPSDVTETAIATFKPLPHRLELVKTINQVEYYNDSLSTVPEAAISALMAFEDHPLVLIAGGFDRGLEFEILAKRLLEPKLEIAALILFKPTGDKIAAALKKLRPEGVPFPIFYAHSMDEAVTLSQQHAKPGTVVLMSPASPSFGMFKDYEDRGNAFKAAVEKLPQA